MSYVGCKWCWRRDTSRYSLIYFLPISILSFFYAEITRALGHNSMDLQTLNATLKGYRTMLSTNEPDLCTATSIWTSPGLYLPKPNYISFRTQICILIPHCINPEHFLTLPRRRVRESTVFAVNDRGLQWRLLSDDGRESECLDLSKIKFQSYRARFSQRDLFCYAGWHCIFPLPLPLSVVGFISPFYVRYIHPLQIQNLIMTNNRHALNANGRKRLNSTLRIHSTLEGSSANT